MKRSMRPALVALCITLVSPLLMTDALAFHLADGIDIPFAVGFYLLGVGYLGYWCEGWLVHATRSRSVTVRVAVALLALPALLLVSAVVLTIMAFGFSLLGLAGPKSWMGLPSFVIGWVALASVGTAVALTLQEVGARLSGSFRTQISVLLLCMTLGAAMVTATMALVPGQLVTVLLEHEKVTVDLDNGEILTGAEAHDWLAAHQTDVQALFTFIGLLLIFPALVSALTRVSSGVVERIEPLQDGFRTVARGEFEVVVEEGGAREFKELARHFNLMVAQLHRGKQLERTFGQYVSPQLLERITATHGMGPIAGETRVGTVLFADIRGFTTMTEIHGAEVVVEVLNRYFGEVVSIIDAHEGYLDKFIGDEVFVVFNGPVDQPDHSERAVRCALTILERVAAMNQDGAFEEVGGLGVGAGVATGSMIVGNVGSSQHLEYTVVGDTVNVAARLTGVASAGEVLINAATANDLPDDLFSQPLDPVTLKGKAKPVVLYRALRKPASNDISPGTGPTVSES